MVEPMAQAMAEHLRAGGWRAVGVARVRPRRSRSAVSLWVVGATDPDTGQRCIWRSPGPVRS